MRFICNILFILLTLTPTLAFAEMIFLKNGSIIDGAIINDAPNSVSVQTQDAGTQIVSRNDILRVVYTKLSLARVHVQKRTGEGFSAYVVDEDQETYTIRMKLDDPAEIVLKRSDVLFIADKNPSGLAGTAEPEAIMLSWLAPYDPVQEYRIFMKKADAADFSPAGTSTTKEFRLAGLSSNTAYRIIVRAMDTAGNESIPSNELLITTGNIPPGSPGKVSWKRNADGSTAVSWDSAVDRDGSVVAYRVYVRKEGAETLAGQTSSLNYVIPKGSAYDTILVKAVDDRGTESPALSETGSRLKAAAPLVTGPSWLSSALNGRRLTVALSPAELFPLGDFASFAGAGFGLLAQAETAVLPDSPFALGMQTGIYRSGGKDEPDKDRSTSSIIMLPFTLFAGYTLPLTLPVDIQPRLGAGLMYAQITYSENTDNGSDTLSSSGADALLWCGITARRTMGSSWFIQVDAGAGAIIGDGVLPYAFCSAGAGLLF